MTIPITKYGSTDTEKGEEGGSVAGMVDRIPGLHFDPRSHAYSLSTHPPVANVRRHVYQDLVLSLIGVEVIVSLVILGTVPVEHGPQRYALALVPGADNGGTFKVPNGAHVDVTWWTVSGLPQNFTISDGNKWFYRGANGSGPLPGGSVQFIADAELYYYSGAGPIHQSDTIYFTVTYWAPYVTAHCWGNQC